MKSSGTSIQYPVFTHLSFLDNRETELHVTLKTPLRLKFENQLSADLSFHLLVRAMPRRLSSLMTAYGSGEPALDYTGLIERATGLKMVDSNLHWYDWKR